MLNSTHIAQTDFILKELNKGHEVDTIYLDFAKAFDKVDHQILLAKLERYGIRGKLLDWIRSFLVGRTQTVVVDGEKSTYQPVRSGVPQGTVLGPVFYILYAIDLILRLLHSKAFSFADDTKLLIAILGVLSQLMLQQDLEVVSEWARQNNMVLH